MKKILLLVAIFSINVAFSQSTPHEHIDEFFKIYSKKGVNKAVDFLYKGSPWKSNISKAIEDQKNKLSVVDKQLGKYYGSILIAEKDIKETFVAVHYLVKYEREPLRFEFKYYKPNKKWILYGFSFDGSLSQELSQSLNIQLLEMDKTFRKAN